MNPTLFLFVAGMLASPPASDTTIVIHRLSGPIVLDGRSDEDAWAHVPDVPFIMFQPHHGAEPSERTEARFAYDDAGFYAAARLYDREPAGVRAVTLKRDILDASNDYFCFLLDTFSDGETSVGFCTTPAGIRLDYTISGDGGALNREWNGVWDAAVARDGTGWFVEIRVPWSTLRFQPQDGQVRMGLTTFRAIARKAEYAVFPARPNRWGLSSLNKSSQMQRVALQDVRGRRPLYLTPYALGGTGHVNALAPDGRSYARTPRPTWEAGLDAKLGVTTNLALDLTLNTDFAQVEADDQQINLTRFSLFFPEKRQFFQERASTFEFRTGEFDRVFHSRRIGIIDGELARVYGGARLVGRVGEWDVGALSMQTARSGAEPGSNATVLRSRRRILNTSSYAGGIVTSRFAETGGAHDVTVGGDAILRVADSDYVSLQLVQTFDAAGDGPPTSLDGGLARARWENRRLDGVGVDLGATWIGPAYAPALGYVQRRGLLRLGDRVSYGRPAAPGSAALRQIWSITGFAALRHEDRSLETLQAGPEWRVDMKSRAELRVSAAATLDDVEAPFLLGSGAGVPAGRYGFMEAGALYRSAPGTARRMTVELRGGSFYDGTRLVASARPTWNVSRHLEIDAAYELNRVAFPARGEALTAQIARLRILAMLDTRSSGAAFVQYNSAARALGANVRLRHNPAEGHDIHLVYNHGLNTDRFLADPVLPFTQNQSITLKYSRMFAAGG